MVNVACSRGSAQMRNILSRRLAGTFSLTRTEVDW